MKEKHIVDILENAPLASLSQTDLMTVRAHAESCLACRRAYEAAQLSTLLIRERAAEVVEPPPFFQTRVLAALKEQQANNVPSFWRLWRSAGALVSSMVATTAALAVLSFLVPAASTSTSQEATAALVPYSAEAVVLDQNQSEDQMSYEQVLSTIYTDEDEAK